MSLIDASISGNLVPVRRLLITGADPNVADYYHNTPLHWASSKGYLEVVKELLHVPIGPDKGPDEGRKRADPNVVNKYGRTPLYLASEKGHLEVVKALLTAEGGGADPNIADDYGETPLYWAFEWDHLEVVEELENYFPSLHTLSLIFLRKFKINISSIPKNFII